MAIFTGPFIIWKRNIKSTSSFYILFIRNHIIIEINNNNNNECMCLLYKINKKETDTFFIKVLYPVGIDNYKSNFKIEFNYIPLFTSVLFS